MKISLVSFLAFRGELDLPKVKILGHLNFREPPKEDHSKQPGKTRSRIRWGSVIFLGIEIDYLSGIEND